MLIVEDNSSTRKIFEIYLSRRFGDVRTASNAQEAMAQAQAHPFDLFVFDINLGPGLSGDQLLQRLRALPEYERTPALACTAYVERKDQEHLFNVGFDAFLAKPFNREQLYAALEPLSARAAASGARPVRMPGATSRGARP